MIFGSVCSGIEAASAAWVPLGWESAWLAEIDKNPSAVLRWRFPNVRNYYDMTILPWLVRTGIIEAPDILVGGCPCQSFSVAGLRQGLADPRGNLTLSFVDLINTVDEARHNEGKEPTVVLYENVPGLLTHKDNPFGCFLAALAGEDVALEPPGGKWADSGCVYGPQRAVAWRILDSQYAAVAQRRSRVFVVASAREAFDPAAVLFEFYGLRRDTPPSRETGQEVAGTLDARTDGGGFPGTDGACAGHVVPACRPGGADLAPTWWDGSPVSQTLDAVLAKGQTMPEKNRFPAVLQPVSVCENQRGELRLSEQTNALTCAGGKPGQGYQAVMEPVPILEAGARTGKSTTDPRAGVGIGEPGDPMYTLQAGKGDAAPCVATEMAVRRLTPVEAERLQGFPDGWTLVPAKKANRKYLTNPRPDYQYVEIDGECWQLMADGPRYKMIGNSMTTTVMSWLGRRIRLYLATYKDINRLVG